MSTIQAILLTGLAAAGTYLSRAGMILLLAGRTLPDPLLRALRQVGPAVLAALTVTFVADPAEAYRGITIPELGALAAAIGIHWRFKNLALTLAVGMVAFWLLRWIG